MAKSAAENAANYRKRHPDRAASSKAKHRAKPESRAVAAAYGKKYREENVERVREWMKAWREENKDRLSAYQKEYDGSRRQPPSEAARAVRRASEQRRYKKDPERYRNRQKEWALKDLDKSRKQGRESELRRRERLMGFSYADLLAAQNGECAICGAENSGHTSTGRAKPLHVDHDHATGKVRALLCHGCNTGIGNLRDNPARLRLAAAYLESHKAGP